MSSAAHPPIDGYEGLVHQNEKGVKTLSLLVIGVHCALCIQKIESKLRSYKNIEQARLNFSTGRLHIAWTGRSENANTYVHEIEGLGYDVQPYNPAADKNADERYHRFLLICLGVAGFAMGNIMLLSVGLWSTDEATMGEGTRAFLHWISAIIALPTIVFAGRPFFQSALSVLRKGHTNMDVPISIALILACSMSLYETIEKGEHVYFDSAVMLMFFLLIGRYLDFRARRNARSAASDLMQGLSGFAHVLHKGRVTKTLIQDLKVGMKILVAAGEKIPADSIIIEGASAIDESLLTGETLPRDVAQGEEVYAGTINQSAPLTLQVSKAAEQSLVSDIARLMEQAEQGQAAYVRIADRAARLYTPVVHVMALLAFCVWFFAWGAAWQEALMIAITVLIITCPCALGLAVPVVQVLATGLLMKRGVLIKSGDALERLAAIDTIFFDKTGTVTQGRLKLIGHYDPDDLRLAASLAVHSQHPLSRAIVDSYKGDDFYAMTSIKEYAGKGLQGIYKSKKYRLGSRSWCGDGSTTESDSIELWLSSDGKPLCCFRFEDQEKADAKATIESLQNSNLDCVLLSGDRESIVQNMRKTLGLSKFYAQHSPQDKHDVLQKYQSTGRSVLMIGDGLNDAPVLAAADVSMAPGSAADISQNTADIVFMGEKLEPVYATYRLAQKTQRLVRENFALAVAYNCVAIPIAFCGFVTPMIAAIAMSGSSLLVIANAYRLRFVR